MQIQSLSVCVPAGCLNNCRFCVAHMLESEKKDYFNQIEQNSRFYDLYRDDFKKRLLFARDNGCNTMMITGNGEPLINKQFLRHLADWNDSLPNPFRWVEIQTSGTTLTDEYLRFLRNTVGVNTISLSLSDIFSSEINADYNQTKVGFEIAIDQLCGEIKRYDFNLRLSLNMTDSYSNRSVESIFRRAQELGADQITFRVFYKSPIQEDCEQNRWIEEHRCEPGKITEVRQYIKDVGNPLEVLPFGATRYSVHGMSVVLDEDCMSQEVKDSVKYLVLRPNCKLYSRWDDKGSLVF